MKRTLEFGKVNAQGKGRINAVEIEINLDDTGELHIVGSIWNRRHTDWISGGQNYDEIAKLLPDSIKVRRIVEIWKRWHLNHMNAGTPAQMEWLRVNGHASYADGGYDADCARLAEADLLYDKDYDRKGVPIEPGKVIIDGYDTEGLPIPFKGYKYGSAWLKEELPAEIVKEIKALMES